MPAIMSLEGPRIDQLRGQLYAAPSVTSSLRGIFDPVVVPVQAHPWVALLGLIAGAYYFTKRKKR